MTSTRKARCGDLTLVGSSLLRGRTVKPLHGSPAAARVMPKMTFLAPEEYQPKCRNRFVSLARRLSTMLPHARIEHIGASSIDGAISKGDLDVFVGVKPDNHQQTVELLAAVGYTVKLDTHRDESMCMLEHADNDVALQVVANGSQYEYFITFRDALNRDPNLVSQYNALKNRHQGAYAATYRLAKSKFIQGVLLQV